MKYIKLTLLFGFAFVQNANAASFDCSKAKSKLEKFICANPSINEADKKMGEAFQEAKKMVALKGYLVGDQRYWLRHVYYQCGARTEGSVNKQVEHCLGILNNRIADLNLMKTSAIYTNYDGDYSDGDQDVTLQVLEVAGKFSLKFQGNTYRTLNHISYCWGEVSLIRKGGEFYEEGEKEALFIKNNNSLELLQRITQCYGPVGEIPPQKFKLR